MNSDPAALIVITRARDRLRKAAFAGGQERLPRRIKFSRRWLDQFRLLRDNELFSPVDERDAGHAFWGCPVELAELGAHAVIDFQDGTDQAVQLDPQ